MSEKITHLNTVARTAEDGFGIDMTPEAETGKVLVYSSGQRFRDPEPIDMSHGERPKSRLEMMQSAEAEKIDEAQTDTSERPAISIANDPKRFAARAVEMIRSSGLRRAS